MGQDSPGLSGPPVKLWGSMETKLPYAYTWPTVFYVGRDELHREDGLIFLRPGDGYIDVRDGNRYRVVDTWFSFDHRGAFDLGLHVFLQPVDEGSEDDRLGRLDPQYFGLSGQ
jgi:hypothetical protein